MLNWLQIFYFFLNFNVESKFFLLLVLLSKIIDKFIGLNQTLLKYFFKNKRFLIFSLNSINLHNILKQ